MKKLIALAKVACKPPNVVFKSKKHSPHLTRMKATFSSWQLQSEPYKSNLCQWGKSLLRIDIKTESEFPSIVVFPLGRGLEPWVQCFRCSSKRSCTRNSAQMKMLFLGHWISKGVIQMDQEKIRSIVDWEVPKKEKTGSSWWSQMLEAILDTTRQLRKSRKLPQPRGGCLLYRNRKPKNMSLFYKLLKGGESPRLLGGKGSSISS